MRINRVSLLWRSWLSAAALIVAVAAFPAQADDSPSAWQVDVYYPVGSIVSYRGHLYQALVSQVDFHDSNWNPEMSNLWKALDSTGFNFHARWFSRVSNNRSRCAMAWSDATIYTTGGVASVDGVNYRANWWTQGQSPSTDSGAEYAHPWTMIGSCAAAGSQTSTAESNDTRSAAPESPAAPGSKTLQAQAEDHSG